MDLNKVITVFKTAGWSGTIYPNLKAAMANINNDNFLWCGYKGQFRRVSPEVCKWHREQKDPECDGCDILKSEKSVGMTSSPT